MMMMNPLASTSSTVLSLQLQPYFMFLASARSSPSRGMRWLRGQASRPGSTTSTTPTSSASTSTPPPSGYSTGTKTEGFLQGTVKTHYARNRQALNRIGVSFLAFYISGQIYVQKVRSSPGGIMYIRCSGLSVDVIDTLSPP